MHLKDSIFHKYIGEHIQYFHRFDKLVVHHIELLPTKQAIVSIEVQHNNKLYFRNVFIDENMNFEIDI